MFSASAEARNIPRITALLPRITEHGGWGVGPVLRMLINALYTCAFLTARHMAVRRRKDLVAYFKASADPVQPGKIQQGGEVN